MREQKKINTKDEMIWVHMLQQRYGANLSEEIKMYVPNPNYIGKKKRRWA